MAPASPYRETDLLVIGAGSGGLAAARMASGKFGAKTLLVESGRLGGTCVNVGCVPKKVTFNAAAIAETIHHHAAAYGFSVCETAPFNWPAFKARRDAYVGRLNDIYRRNIAADKIDLLHGRARLLSRNEVEVSLSDGSTARVRARRIIVATGGHPAPPPIGIPGSELGINSDGFFDIDALPARVAIVGAGYIAVEFAGMLNALGVNTHLFIRHRSLLRSFDSMIQDAVMEEYVRSHVHLHKLSGITHIERQTSGKLSVSFTDEYHTTGSQLADVDHVIWAIGRLPDTKDLGLKEAGVRLNEQGYVAVDKFQNTSVDGIYALGDVSGQVQLTPVAISAGRRLAERLFGGPEFSSSRLDYANIPSVVFAHPEVGSIGLTEAEAIDQFGAEAIKVYHTRFSAMYYALMESHAKPFTNYKLIVSGPTERVVGLHIVGLGSAEMLQGFGVAIKMGATKRDIDSCVAIHPTSAEELVTLK